MKKRILSITLAMTMLGCVRQNAIVSGGATTIVIDASKGYTPY